MRAQCVGHKLCLREDLHSAGALVAMSLGPQNQVIG